MNLMTTPENVNKARCKAQFQSDTKENSTILEQQRLQYFIALEMKRKSISFKRTFSKVRSLLIQWGWGILPN